MNAPTITLAAMLMSSFEVKTGTSQHSSHANSRTMFTPKGVEWNAGLWAIHQLQQQGVGDGL